MGNLNVSADKYAYNITEGTAFDDIQCKAICHPNCSYTWSLDGTEINSTDGLLDLGTANKSSSGVYTCVASRENGKNEFLDLDIKVICK